MTISFQTIHKKDVQTWIENIFKFQWDFLVFVIKISFEIYSFQVENFIFLVIVSFT